MTAAQDKKNNAYFVSAFEYNNVTGWDSSIGKQTRSFTKFQKPDNVEIKTDVLTFARKVK
jgi:hypothetical protein